MTLGELQYVISKTPLGAGVDAEVLLHYINLRIEMICRSRPWSRLRKTATIQTVAEYITGTVSITVGATAGTGTDTVFTTAMTGRRIRIANLIESYVFTYVSPTSFTIDRAYEATDDAVLAAFNIFQPVYALPSDLSEVTSLRNPTLGIELQEVDRTYLNQNASARWYTNLPRVYAPYPDSATDLAQIELYPAPSQAMGLPLEYNALPPLFDTADPDTEAVFPDWLSIPCIRAGVEADLYDMQGDGGGKQRREMDYERHLAMMAGEDARRSPVIETNIANRYTARRAQRTWRGRGQGRSAMRNWNGTE